MTHSTVITLDINRWLSLIAFADDYINLVEAKILERGWVICSQWRVNLQVNEIVLFFLIIYRIGFTDTALFTRKVWWTCRCQPICFFSIFSSHRSICHSAQLSEFFQFWSTRFIFECKRKRRWFSHCSIWTSTTSKRKIPNRIKKMELKQGRDSQSSKMALEFENNRITSMWSGVHSR